MKSTLFSLILLFLFLISCSKKQDDALNMPPSSFSITEITLSKSPNTAAIFWEQSIDPELDDIYYQIELFQYFTESESTEIIESLNLEETSYIFEDLNIFKKYKIQIIALDSNGNQSETVSSDIEFPMNFNAPSPVEGFEYVYDRTNSMITITWENSTDPDGDEISYEFDIYSYPTNNTNDPRVYIAENLNINDLSYTFETNESRKYYINITSVDIYGNRNSPEANHIIFILPTGTWEGDLNLNTQDEVNEFFDHNIQIVNGDIRIGAPYARYIGGVLQAFSEPIVDLSPLSGIEVINGDVYINSYHYHQFENLVGFEEVTTIQGNITIEQSPSVGVSNGYQPNFMKSLDGLSNLFILGGLKIKDNLALESFEGLNNLVEIGGDITIRNNSNLLSFSGFNNLSSIGGNLIISGSLSLSTINAFNNVNFISGILSIYRTQITNLNFLTNLSEVDELVLGGNAVLVNTNGLNLSVLNTILVRDNNLLESINFTQGNINPSRPVFLRIMNNPNLSNIQVLDGIETFTSIDINNNPKLISLNSISDVVSVQNYLRIQNNDLLQDLEPLSNLILIECGSVASDGGENQGNLAIVGNYNLTNFCGLTNFFVSNGLCSLDFSINQNAFNPTNQDIINGNCSN
jgi:hypothetical protein